jgi:hypothetical protein
MHVSYLDYIQILYHENPVNGIRTPVICMWTLFSMKLRDDLPHAAISHVFPSLLISDVRIPFR